MFSSILKSNDSQVIADSVEKEAKGIERKEKVVAQLIKKSQVLLEENARLNLKKVGQLKEVSSEESGAKQEELCSKCKYRSVHDFWAQEETEAKPAKKKVVELHRSLVDCKYDLEAERTLREKAQSQLIHMQIKLDDMAERLDETESKLSPISNFNRQYIQFTWSVILSK